MALSTRLQVIAALVLILAATSDTLQPTPRVAGSNSKLNKLSQYEETDRYVAQMSSPARYEIEEYRIQFPEPYKSLIQTALKFAIVQLKISNHINIDTAMSLINDASFMLSKPSNLCKAVKIVAVTIATIIATTFMFPGAYRTAEGLWRDPVNALNLDKYLHGFNEKSALGIVSARVDDMLNKVGLYEVSCRERTICHAGEILKNTFPNEAEVINKFASEHHLFQTFNKNKYFHAFNYGFVDRNCSAIATTTNQAGQNCLGTLLSSLVLSGYGVDYQSLQQPRNEYQNIKVARA